MSDLIGPDGQPLRAPKRGRSGHGDAMEVVNDVVRKQIEKMQARIKDNRCPYCGYKLGNRRIKIVEQEIPMETVNIFKLVQTTVFKRETWIKNCPKHGSFTVNFGPDTKLTTGTKLEEEGII